MDALRHELKALIIETLGLKQVTPESIDDAAPLFGEGLGLDSLDALELAVAVEYRYGLDEKLDAEKGRAAFASVDALASFVQAHRTT